MNPHENTKTSQVHNNIVHLETPLGSLQARWEEPDAQGSLDNSDTTRHGVLQCLNIPYAEIPRRWAQPHKTVLPWKGTRDCTQFGPGCPQLPPPLFAVDGIPMFGRLSSADETRPERQSIPIRPDCEDEFACLNLNIYAPATKTADGQVHLTPSPACHQPLPVLVWVHGGSYQVGAGSVEAYDGTNLVQRSMALEKKGVGKAVIVVTINYRLGVLGFLFSRELAAEAAQHQESSDLWTGNLGMADVKRAFEWVKANIRHFGGDPDKITAVGESAGAGLIHHLTLAPNLHIHVPRVFLSSSTCNSIQLVRQTAAQSTFDTICRHFGISPEEPKSVSSLRDIPIARLVTETAFVRGNFGPIWDDVTICNDPRRAVFEPELWDSTLQSLVLGTCHNETWLRAAAGKTGKTNDLETVIAGYIPDNQDSDSSPPLRQRALQLYIDPDSFLWFQRPMVSRECLCSLALEGHHRYYAPAALYSRSFMKRSASTSLYRYVFSYATAHWPETWPVTHTADLLPLFLHPSLGKDSEDRRVSETFADNLLQFVAGMSSLSWTPYTANAPQLNQLGVDGQWSIVEEGADTFGLAPAHLQLWKDAMRDIVATGRQGWPKMAR